MRFGIQTKIKVLHKTLNRFNKILRDKGYNNLSDAIRLLESGDAFQSLKSSYDRIHLTAGQQLPAQKKFDLNRANFRKDITRRMASAVVKKAHDCNIVFIENLSFRDDEKNYLLKLFSCKTLMKFIEEALNEKNIHLVEVDKDGTSRIDPLTGLPGYRPKYDKSKLYVERNGEIV